MCKKLMFGALLFTGAAITAFEHGNREGEVSFDKAGEKYLVTGRDFVLLDKTGKQVKLLNRNGYAVTAAAFASDDSFIAALVGQNKLLKIMDLNGKELASIKLRFDLHDSAEIKVVGVDSTIILHSNKQIFFYEYSKGKLSQRATLPFPDPTFVNAYDVSLNGKYIFVNDRRFIALKSPKSWIFREAKNFVTVNGKIRKVRISDDGSKVLVLHQNGRALSLHKAEDGTLLKSYLLTSAINEIECDGKLEKAYFNGGSLNLSNGSSETLTKLPEGRMNISANSNEYSVGSKVKKDGVFKDFTAPYVLFNEASFDGDILRVSNNENSFQIDVKEGLATRVANKTFYKGRFKGLVGKSSDGRYGVDFSGRVYDYRQKAYIGRPLFGAGGYVMKADISKSGDIAFMGSKTLYLYNYKTKKSLGNYALPFELQQNDQVSVRLSPDAAHCAIAYVKENGLGAVLVLERKTGKFKTLTREVKIASDLWFTSSESLMIAAGKTILTTVYNGNKWVIKDTNSLLIESGRLYKIVVGKVYVAGLNENGRIHIFDYESGLEMLTTALKSGSRAMEKTGK